MENTNKAALQITLNVQIPSNIVNFNQKYVQEVLQQIIDELCRNHPEALNANSPTDIYEKLNIAPIHKLKNTGKWKKFAQGLRQHAMGKEAGEVFDKGRKEFHDNFIMTNPVDNEKT